MCGIVGVLGLGPVAGSIVDALKRLEYRGYDSAGVATLENGKLERRRAEGKLKNLEAKLAAAPLSGSIGIGHTRWATHGKPTETNAHPHASPGLAVVHNGIIENFKALREELATKGYAFATETDSEIAAFVVEDELAKGKSPADAVHAALKRLRGAFALVYLFEGEDNLLIGARQGAPLAVGFGDGEMYLGSDALALAPFTDRVAYLEEGDWVVVRREGADIRDASGKPVQRRVQRSPAGSLLAEKGNYRHFMAKEIHEQRKSSNMQEVAARGGRLVLIGEKHAAEEAAVAIEHFLAMPEMGANFAPIVYAAPIQMLAYHTAVIMGKDADQPRNLAKSVTVE
jgi:glucosamine--fructose-6-phosphate aminotransferase (isomerizing)